MSKFNRETQDSSQSFRKLAVAGDQECCDVTAELPRSVAVFTGLSCVGTGAEGGWPSSRRVRTLQERLTQRQKMRGSKV